MTTSPLDAARRIAEEANINVNGSQRVPEIRNTDLGNARRLVARHGEDLHYVFAWNSWLVWDTRRWARDATGEVERRAKETVGSMYADAASQDDEDTRRELAKWALRSEAQPRISAMIELSKSEPGIPVAPREIDADPWLLNTQNGTIDLRTGQLKPHDREDLLMQVAAASYEPDARMELWDQFVADIADGDPELAIFNQHAVGASLSGVAIEMFFFAHGPKWTGKSTFLEAVSKTLGDYAKTADFETFLVRDRIGGPRSDLARLPGVRFVKSIEVTDGRKLAEGLLKSLTGGDTITVRDMYAREFEYLPQFTLWLAANDAPAVRADDDALWRRLHRVPFTHEFKNPDPTIKATLTDPAVAGEAILQWAVQGCLEWQEAGGIEVPEAVRRSTAEYREEVDILGEFLTDKSVGGETYEESSSRLYHAYLEWAREQGIKERHQLSHKAFGNRLTKRFQKKHTGTGTIYLGVKLRA